MPLVHFIGRLSLWTGRLGAMLVVPLMAAMVYEVVSRYAFAAPTDWAFEISYMMMGSIFLLGIAYALAVGQHVNVDFIHDRLPRRVIALIDALGYVVLTGMMVWIVIVLAQNAVAAFHSGEGSGLSAWNPRIWPYRVVYCFGFGLFALQTFAKALENLLVASGFVVEAHRS